MNENNEILNKKDCYDAIDEAVLRLAVLSLAESEGRDLWEENARYKSLNEFQLSDKIDKRIRSTIRKQERKADVLRFVRNCYPALGKVAILFFAVSLCFYSTLAVSANFRKIIYTLLLSYDERYTQINTNYGHLEEFFDVKYYEPLEHAYGLTFVPSGFVIDEHTVTDTFADLTYVSTNTNQHFTFYQNSSGNSSLRIDTENAESVDKIEIRDSEVIIVEKDDVTSLSWQVGNTIISLSGNCGAEVLIEIANGVHMIK